MCPRADLLREVTGAGGIDATMPSIFLALTARTRERVAWFQDRLRLPFLVALDPHRIAYRTFELGRASFLRTYTHPEVALLYGKALLRRRVPMFISVRTDVSSGAISFSTERDSSCSLILIGPGRPSSRRRDPASRRERGPLT